MEVAEYEKMLDELKKLNENKERLEKNLRGQIREEANSEQDTYKSE